jgi:uncharacterized protein (TIGR02217 family)
MAIIPFHEVVFPLNFSVGAVGGPTFLTDVAPLRGGGEQRAILWSRARNEYDVSQAIRTQEEYEQLQSFFYARHGRAFGFLYKDYKDWKSGSAVRDTTPVDQPCARVSGGVITIPPVFVGNGSTSTYLIYKTYGADPYYYFRPIRKPIEGTVTVAIDGVTKTETTDYAVDYTTGIITFVVAPGVDAVVTAGYCYYVPVRFEIDKLLATHEMYNVHTWGNIPLFELKI